MQPRPPFRSSRVPVGQKNATYLTVCVICSTFKKQIDTHDARSTEVSNSTEEKIKYNTIMLR